MLSEEKTHEYIYGIYIEHSWNVYFWENIKDSLLSFNFTCVAKCDILYSDQWNNFLMVKGPRLFWLISLLSDLLLRESLELWATLDFCFSLREFSWAEAVKMSTDSRSNFAVLYSRKGKSYFQRLHSGNSDLAWDSHQPLHSPVVSWFN